MEDWVINSVGKRVYDYTNLKGYISKLYGVSPRLISKDWGVHKLKFLRNLSPFKLGIKTAVVGDKGGRVVSYPPLGIEMISKHLAKSFLELGGEIILNAKVTAASCTQPEAGSPDRSSADIYVKYVSDEKEASLKGDFLISTIPVDELTRMLTPAPNEEVLKATTSLRYRTLITLFLCVNKEHVTKYGCVYFSEERFPFKRISEFTNMSEKMAPVGKSSLCVEITCFNDDEILRKDDKYIHDLVLTALEQEGFLHRTKVEKYKVLRISNAYPVYDLNYYENLGKVFGYLSTFNRVISIGRQGLFSYNIMKNSLNSGLFVGKGLSTTDSSTWNQLIQERYSNRLEKYHHALRKADLRLGEVY